MKVRCQALGQEVSFDGESWSGGDGSRLADDLLGFLNRNTEPRHAPTDPEDLGVISAVLAYVEGEILEVTGQPPAPPAGAIY